jgi:alpha/beta superfamily hydrolase
VVTGDRDEIVPVDSVRKLVDKLNQQRGINVEHKIVPEANHFFSNRLDELDASVVAYLTAASEAAETG